jgi:hypothetical protein
MIQKEVHMEKLLVEANLIEQALNAIEREMPENVARHHLGPKLGHYPSFPYSRGYMQNCDCDGTGPGEKFFMGRYIYYTRSSLLEWLRVRMKANV